MIFRVLVFFFLGLGASSAHSSQISSEAFSSLVRTFLFTENEERALGILEDLISQTLEPYGDPEEAWRFEVLQAVYDQILPTQDLAFERFTILMYALQDSWLLPRLEPLMRTHDRDYELSRVSFAVVSLGLVVSVFSLARTGFLKVESMPPSPLLAEWFRRMREAMLAENRREPLIGARTLYGTAGSLLIKDHRNGPNEAARLPTHHRQGARRAREATELATPSPLERVRFHREPGVTPVDPVSYLDAQFEYDVTALGSGFVLSLVAERKARQSLAGSRLLTRLGWVRFATPAGMLISSAIWTGSAFTIESALEARHIERLHRDLKRAVDELESAEAPLVRYRQSLHSVNALGEAVSYLRYQIVSRYLRLQDRMAGRMRFLTQQRENLDRDHYVALRREQEERFLTRAIEIFQREEDAVNRLYVQLNRLENLLEFSPKSFDLVRIQFELFTRMLDRDLDPHGFVHARIPWLRAQ